MNIDEFENSLGCSRRKALSYLNCFGIFVRVDGYVNFDLEVKLGQHFNSALAIHHYLKDTVDIDSRIRMLEPYKIQCFVKKNRSKVLEQALCEAFNYSELELRNFLMNNDIIPNTANDRRFYDAIGHEYEPD